VTGLRDNPTATLVGLTALAFSALYLLSDVIEAIQGGFSGSQLGLTLIAEAAIPIFVIGLYLVQRPHIGRLGQLSAAAYAYSYVFFTGTVIYALADGTSDYNALSHDLQPWMTIHGTIMVLAGLGFGFAVIRAKVLPPWTGIALMAGVVLVSLSQTLPEGPQVLAAAIRGLGFAGMGAALLGAERRSPQVPTGRAGVRHHAGSDRRDSGVGPRMTPPPTPGVRPEPSRLGGAPDCTRRSTASHTGAYSAASADSLSCSWRRPGDAPASPAPRPCSTSRTATLSSSWPRTPAQNAPRPGT
jgi:hypothetical protein